MFYDFGIPLFYHLGKFLMWVDNMSLVLVDLLSLHFGLLYFHFAIQIFQILVCQNQASRLYAYMPKCVITRRGSWL